MKHLLILLTIQLFSSAGNAQNIVENGDLESGSNNFHGIGTVDFYSGSSSIPPPHEGTAAAYSGYGFAGIRVYHGYGDYQEYLFQEFDPGEMQAGITYKVSFNYMLNDAAIRTTDDFGITFFSESLPSAPVINYDELLPLFKSKVPQIRNPKGAPITNYTNWQEISGYYTATGNEKFFALGCFKDDATLNLFPISTNYNNHNDQIVIYVDKISIVPCSSTPYIEIPDKVFCEPGTAIIQATNTEASYTWSTGETGNSIAIDETPAIYWVDADFGNCVLRDSITVRKFSGPANPLPDVVLCKSTEYPYLVKTEGAPGETLTWNDGDSQAVKFITTPGTYTITKSLGNCSWSDTFTVKTFENVNAYPNPVTDKLNFTGGEVIVNKIYTSDGKLLHSTPTESTNINYLVNTLVPSTYFIEIEESGCKEILKFEKIEK